MENVKIIFNDENYVEAEQNGDCYIVDEKPQFPHDLSNVTIEGEEIVHFDNAKLIECASVDGRYWFAFKENSPTEVRISELEDALIELAELLG